MLVIRDSASVRALGRAPVLEQARPGARDHGVDLEPQLVEQVGVQERFDEREAAVDADVLARLALELADRRDQVVAEHGRAAVLAPGRVLERSSRPRTSARG